MIPISRRERPPRQHLRAAAVAGALAVAAMGGSFAVYQFTHRSVPVYMHPTAASCSHQNVHMVTSEVGWSGTSRTVDGGVTWRDVSPPSPPNRAIGGVDTCVLDAANAWTTEASGPKADQPDRLTVFATNDGGRTWRSGTPVPFSSSSGRVLLEFIDTQHGWLLIDSSSVALYATTDGGDHWSLNAAGSLSLGGSIAPGCPESGMTFINLKRGWLTWDCSHPSGGSSSSPGGNQQVGDKAPRPSVIAATNDGGGSWALVEEPSFPSDTGNACSASPPTFTNDAGVLPVSCMGASPASAVFWTSDGGYTWAVRRLPINGDLSQLAFADAMTGFLFARTAGSNKLYRTDDGGRSWSVVTSGLFLGQTIQSVQFIDSSTGFVYTDTSPQAPWKTDDGGRTWTLPAGYRTVPGDIVCNQPFSSVGSVPVPVAMFSSTVGWAAGALRTTDGGLHWLSLAPPSVTDRSLGSAEFYLDATHAWVAESAGSASACADHVVVFSTSDAGKSWQQSTSIPVPVTSAGASIWEGGITAASRTSPVGGASLDFVDPENGWLLARSGPLGGEGPQRLGPLYRTTDGGLHWQVLSDQPGVSQTCSSGGGGIRFSSSTTGWMPYMDCGGTSCNLQTTHDGGATWALQTVEAAGCNVDTPVFFDQNRGLARFSDFSALNSWVATTDGGRTWTAHTAAITFYFTGDFIDQNHGWIIGGVGDPSSYPPPHMLLHTGDGGRTWSVVNANLPPGSTDGSYTLSYALAFSDDRNGLLSTSTALYRTTDGGQTWNALNPGA